MSSFFIDLEIESDEQTLADEAIDRLKARWAGWEPDEGDMEVIQIETLSPMAADSARAAGKVPAAIFRAYGSKLVGEPYSSGSPATTTATFIAADMSAHTIDSGTEIDIDGHAFTVDVSTDIASGAASASGVSVTSREYGTEVNGLTGESVVNVSALTFLSDIVIEKATSGGTDPDDDNSYQESLSRKLLLQAKTLVTTRDFELWALDKDGVGRALAVHTGDRAVTVVTTDPDGEILATAIKNELIADFAQYRLVNTVLTMADPTYTTVNVTTTVKAYPGTDTADLQARIAAVLGELLSPGNWGRPKAAEMPDWVLDNVVRANLLIDRIGDVDDVNYVSSISITGSAGSASGSDWTMAGTYALPRPGTFTVTIT